MRLRCVEILAAAALVLLAPDATHAATITFGSVNVDRLDLAGTQEEAAFSYWATGDGWELQTLFANPGAALATFFNGTNSDPGDTVSFMRTDGGVFSFDTIDLRGIGSNSDSVIATGYRGGVTIASSLLAIVGATGFTGFSSGFPPLALDLLTITVADTVGTNGALILDNIVLTPVADPTPVPEPTTLLLTACGVAVLIVKRRRGRRHSAI